MEIIKSPFVGIIADLAKNNKNLTPALQDAIAKYLTLNTQPILTIKPYTFSGGDIAKGQLFNATNPAGEPQTAQQASQEEEG